MLGIVIKMLQADDWYNISQDVELAKGRYELVDSWPALKRHVKRIFKSRYYGKRL